MRAGSLGWICRVKVQIWIKLRILMHVMLTISTNDIYKCVKLKDLEKQHWWPVMKILVWDKKWLRHTIFACLDLVEADQIWLPKLVLPSQKCFCLENQKNLCQALSASDVRLHSINDNL